ncbi:hypothetical protein Mth01_23200 [Sphaerimonospora thailandensis]|uniref:Uncharacterized protein n=1 Tax=Sphaerimonospora thailandensis TaxID=795644 RepID=A0A8J3VZ15_9ACTN|nr:hypothetical protein Mth01_23200 [Sphaerimonospora thailandensis]
MNAGDSALSRSADIQFTFHRPVQVPVTLRAMLAQRISFSWNGVVSYLIDEDGMYVWKEVPDVRLTDEIDYEGEARCGRTSRRK